MRSASLLLTVFISACSIFNRELSDTEITEICIDLTEAKFSKQSIKLINIEEDFCYLEIIGEDTNKTANVNSRLIGSRVVKVNYKTKDLSAVPRR